MIRLTRINHDPVVLNSDLIEHIDQTPDTVISMTTGQKLMVLESPEEIIARVIAFRRRVGVGLWWPARHTQNEQELAEQEAGD